MRFWQETIIRANPKKKTKTGKEAISSIVANATILLMCLCLNIVGTIFSKLVPYNFQQIPIVLELFIFLIMLFSIIRRSAKVNEWREKQIKSAK